MHSVKCQALVYFQARQYYVCRQFLKKKKKPQVH